MVAEGSYGDIIEELLIHFRFIIGTVDRPCVCVLSGFSCIHFFANPGAQQAPLSMEFSKQEYRNKLSFPAINQLYGRGM